MPPDKERSSVFCQLRPRQDASADQLHGLFDRLVEWTERESANGHGRILWFDNLAAWSMELGPEPIAIDFTLHRDAPFDRACLIRYLKDVIPPDLVEDVCIDGRSWNDEKD